MPGKLSGENVEDSASFQSARERAAHYAQNPGKLNDLLDRAKPKALASRGRLREVWESLMAAMRLLRAYASGQYRDIPWGSLLSIIATVIYFVTPFDLIPDFLLGFGLIDDAALVGWILSCVKSDIDNFIRWEKLQVESAQEIEAGIAQSDR